MEWSQYPLSTRQTGERDDVANLHGGSIDHDAVDEQLDQGAALLLGRVLEPADDGGAEVFQAGGHLLALLRSRGLGRPPLFLLPQGRQALLEAAAARAQLIEGQRLRRVGVDQALDLPRHLPLTLTDLPQADYPFIVVEPTTLSALEGLLQHDRLGQQPAEVCPDGGVQALRPHLPRPAGPPTPAARLGEQAGATEIGVAPIIPDRAGEMAPPAAAKIWPERGRQ
jgi:hypothetical protein